MTPRALCIPGAVLVVTASLWGSTAAVNARATGAWSGAHPKQNRDERVGFLLATTGANEEGCCAGRPIPYYPKPGDIVLYDNHKRAYHFVYAVAGSGPPTHTALVMPGAEGRPALLDLAGSRVMNAKVVIMDVAERLNTYDGSIWVRRLRCPLSPEQCGALAEYARAQDGKSFASGRIVLQITPIRPRTGLRYHCFAHTYFNRRRWLCSEVVVAAACAAHILDPHVYPANAIYPRDLAFDERYDLSDAYEPPLSWLPEPIPAATP